MHMPAGATAVDSVAANGNLQKPTLANEKSTSGQVTGVEESARETPGLAHLAVCVLGIYASLYVSPADCVVLLAREFVFSPVYL